MLLVSIQAQPELSRAWFLIKKENKKEKRKKKKEKNIAIIPIVT